jgi:hypothetical protein
MDWSYWWLLGGYCWTSNPATTLWEVLKYIQIVFDTQKFKYRSYTLLGYNPFYNSKISNPINGVSGLVVL